MNILAIICVDFVKLDIIKYELTVNTIKKLKYTINHWTGNLHGPIKCKTG